jgi:hypothetical protein
VVRAERPVGIVDDVAVEDQAGPGRQGIEPGQEPPVTAVIGSEVEIADDEGGDRVYVPCSERQRDLQAAAMNYDTDLQARKDGTAHRAPGL